MGNKYLSDVIDYERDIKKHHFVAIYSGVGSGKNTFIDSFYKKDSMVNNPKMTVLLITSRRAKVDEILDANAVDIQGKIGKWGNLHIVKGNEESEEDFKQKYKDFLRVIERGEEKHFVYQQSVVCTYAFIEKYLQYIYRPNDITTHLWELFDMIVIDEAHSLIADASYQSAPFYVNELINEYLVRYKQGEENHHLHPQCKHLILMTGTPEHLGELDCYSNESLHLLNKMEECVNVVPQNIHFISRTETQRLLERQLENGKKGIYFSNHISTAKDIYNQLPDDDKTATALSFSDTEQRKLATYDVQKNMVETETCIKNNGKFPEHIKLLISTSRNKEGINISDEKITELYVEANHRDDIIQMSGRVRNGVENMYVVLNPTKRNVEESMYETTFTLNVLFGIETKKDILNEYWNKLCEEHGSALAKNNYCDKTAYEEEWSAEFIDYIHDKFPYVKYSYFTNEFEFYTNCWSGRWNYEVSEYDFNIALREKGKIDKVFGNWFPNSIVHPCKYVFTDKGMINEECISSAIEYIRNYMRIGEKYSINQRKCFVKDLNDILKTSYTRINNIFKYLGIECQMVALTKNGKENKKKPTNEDTPFYTFMNK